MIFLYTNLKDKAGKRLHKSVKSVLPLEEIKVFQTIDELSLDLRLPKKDTNILVFLADTRKELTEIISLGDMLCDFRIILILPDWDEETISQGLKLRPSFFTYKHNNFNEVVAVIEKIHGNDNLKKAV